MILIAVGSSLPFCGIDSQQIVLSAFFAIGRIAELDAQSSLYNTPAWPDPTAPAFVNAACSVRTDLSPEVLMSSLHAIEAGFGRQRLQKNEPRTLDLDLIAYGHERRDSAAGRLHIPHARLAEREFVLAPLSDIAPDWTHPETGKSVREMLEALPIRSARRISV